MDLKKKVSKILAGLSEEARGKINIPELEDSIPHFEEEFGSIEDSENLEFFIQEIEEAFFTENDPLFEK